MSQVPYDDSRRLGSGEWRNEGMGLVSGGFRGNPAIDCGQQLQQLIDCRQFRVWHDKSST